MIVLPTPAPIACSVVPPSAISENEAGHRPLTTVGCADPRTDCVTNTFAPTDPPRDRSVTKFRRPAAVIQPTCGSRSRSASVSPALPYGFPASYCQPTPYRRGVSTRWLRLAPNVMEATSAATEMAAPTSALRTGVAVRPRPGSSALRTPATAVGASPARAHAPAPAEGRDRDGSRTPPALPRALAARHAGPAAIANVNVTSPAAPVSSTNGSKESPPAR